PTMTTHGQIEMQPRTDQAAADFMREENLRLGETPRGWPPDASDGDEEANKWSRVASTLVGTDLPPVEEVEEPLGEHGQWPATPWSIITAAVLGASVGLLVGFQF